ncbi:MAG: TonB-dependent receptor [Pseudohongiellaceae bacterium]|jgi:iron complex outermembrane recepter protein
MRVSRLAVAVQHGAALLALGGLVGSSSLSAQQLEEITVTAQLREENIQQVPLAVTAVSGKTLDEASLKDVVEMMTSVPSLLVGTNQSSSTGNFSIRGVGTGAQNFGLESSVGLYVDGVYRARQSSIINQLVDVEAVEILRGPQGTLFGKNSASGALLIRTVKPSDEQNGFVDVTVGNLSLVNFSAAGNFQLGERLSARSTVFTSNRDGFVDAGLGDELNDRKRWGLRQQFLYEGDDDLSVRLIADYAKIEEVCCAALTVKDSLFASDRRNGTAPIPGSDAIVQQLGGTIYRTGTFDDYRMSLNQLPRSEATDSGLSLQVDKRLGNLDFVSISALRTFDTDDSIDADFTNVDLASREYGADQRMLSQEFRLSSDASERVRFLGGLFLYRQDIDSNDFLSLGTRLPNYVVAAAPNTLGKLVAAQPLLPFINQAWGTKFPTSFAPVVVPGNRIHDSSDQQHEAVALFGSVDFDLTDQLQVNLGLRYTDESKTMKSTFRESVPTPGPTALNVTAVGTAFAIAEAQYKRLLGAPPGDGTGVTHNAVLAGLNPAPFIPALGVLFQPGWATCSVTARFCPRPDIDATLDDERVTGNAGLSYRPADSTLVYVSYGTGYKSGGTNTDRIGLGFDTVFNAEDTTNVEIGVKHDFSSALRLNLAIYDMQVDDLQTNTFTGTAFNLQNAGKVDVNGVEAEVWWSPMEGLDTRLAYAYTDATFNDFEKGNCQISNIFHTGAPAEAAQKDSKGYCNRNGDRVGNVPEHFTSLNVAKQFRVAEYDAQIAVEYVYYSDAIMHSNNDPFAAQGARSLLNINAMLQTAGGYELLLWGRNLADESWFGTVFDTPLQDGKLSAYPREPRTYGLSLRRRF